MSGNVENAATSPLPDVPLVDDTGVGFEEDTRWEWSGPGIALAIAGDDYAERR